MKKNYIIKFGYDSFIISRVNGKFIVVFIEMLVVLESKSNNYYCIDVLPLRHNFVNRDFRIGDEGNCVLTLIW